MDELEAVNILLDNIGTAPVNSLTTGHPDANSAQRMLDRYRKKIQQRGWWFNIDYNVTFQRENVTNRIAARDIVSIEIPDQHVIKRGDYLYNRVTQSYIFTEDVYAYKVLRYVEWDDLPEVAQEYAVNLAGVEFVRNDIEDVNIMVSLREQAEEARQLLVAQDLQEQNFNIFDTPRIARARAGRRPYGRGAGRFDPKKAGGY